jgi:hypothetical protein
MTCDKGAIMFNLTKLTVACGLLAGICFAESASDQEKYYHLDFVVKELDGGKVVNARHYLTSMMTGRGDGGGCNIRTGSKVPVPVSGGSTQFTYIDVGVNIDCQRGQEIDGNLALGVVAEVSSAASSPNPPIIRQNKWNSRVIVPIGKATMVFSSDDLASKGQIQVELTATPIK